MVTLAWMSAPGSNAAFGLPSLPRPRSPVRTPMTRSAVVQHVLAGEPPEQIDAFGLHLLGQPLGERTERDDVVAVIVKRRRRDRQADLALLRQEIDVVVVDRRAERRALGREIRNQVLQRRGIEQRARQLMRTGLAAPSRSPRSRAARRPFLQLRETQRRREPGGPAADDQDVDFERFAIHSPQVPSLKPLGFLQFGNQCRRQLEQIALEYRNPRLRKSALRRPC